MDPRGLSFRESSPSMLTASSANSCTERCMPRQQGTKNVRNVPKRLTDRLTVLAEEVGWEQHLCHRTTDLHMQNCRLYKKIMLARTIKKSFSCASSTSYSWTISEIWIHCTDSCNPNRFKYPTPSCSWQLHVPPFHRQNLPAPVGRHHWPWLRRLPR